MDIISYYQHNLDNIYARYLIEKYLIACVDKILNQWIIRYMLTVIGEKHIQSKYFGF